MSGFEFFFSKQTAWLFEINLLIIIILIFGSFLEIIVQNHCIEIGLSGYQNQNQTFIWKL